MSYLLPAASASHPVWQVCIGCQTPDLFLFVLSLVLSDVTIPAHIVDPLFFLKSEYW